MTQLDVVFHFNLQSCNKCSAEQHLESQSKLEKEAYCAELTIIIPHEVWQKCTTFSTIFVIMMNKNDVADLIQNFGPIPLIFKSFFFWKSVLTGYDIQDTFSNANNY